jgi:hypothetical protein
MEKRYTPENIRTLAQDEAFVFGSNDAAEIKAKLQFPSC